MEATVAILAVLLTLAGLFLGAISRMLERSEAKKLAAEQARKLMESSKGGGPQFLIGVAPPPAPQPKGFAVLTVFAVIVVIFGLFTTVRYWPYIRNHLDEIFFGAWLFIAMLFGMFAQVLATYLPTKQPLRQLEANQVLFPLLFSIVVFYPIWGTAGSASHGFFSFYAAFLNGFFWRNAVAQAKPPAPPASSPPVAR